MLNWIPLVLAMVAAGWLQSSTPRLPSSGQAATANHKYKAMGEGKVIGTIYLRGVLHHSKGAMGQVGDFIVPASALCDSNSKQWQPAYEALVGKEVLIKGEHYRYVCSPIEQCLEGGVINSIQKVAYIEAAIPITSQDWAKERSGKGEDLGVIKASGKVGDSKGMNLSLEKYLIVGFAQREFFGNHDREFRQECENKQVEVEATYYRYDCGPDEQCLSSGVMHILRDLRCVTIFE